MTFQLISAEEWTERCNADGEFSIAARHWNGGIKIIAEATTVCIGVENGIAGIYQPEHAHGLLTFEAPAATWEKQLAELPPRFFNDVMANIYDEVRCLDSAMNIISGAESLSLIHI